MAIVTLTTDLGEQDYYVAAIKGAFLKQRSDLQIVDVTHRIQHYDIVQGAFVLQNAYRHFPEGSVHVIHVNNLNSKEPSYLAFEREGHFFLGPDNGIFSLIFPLQAIEAVRLKPAGHDPFPLTSLYAEAVGRLLSGSPLKELGEPAGDLLQRIHLQPIVTKTGIRGTVVYIDHYENAIVNVHRDLFEKVAQDRPAEIWFKRHDPIRRIYRHYHEVPVGEVVCFFNSSGLLEIAVNMGKAGSLLGLQVDDTVQIDFVERKKKT